MREWALWAVRNMCEISAEAQETIKCVRLTGLTWQALTQRNSLQGDGGADDTQHGLIPRTSLVV
jgi:hypothetical protein